MHNLCPYFWLLVFSLLVCIVVLPIKGIIKVLLWFEVGYNTLLDKIFIPVATSWEEKLTDLDVYQIYSNDKQINKLYKKYFEVEDYYRGPENFVYKWFEKTHGKKVYTKDVKDLHYYNRSQFYTREFFDWQAKCGKELSDLKDEKRLNELEKTQFEESLSDIRSNAGDWFDRIANIVSSWKNIIRWTKRVVGLLVTSVGLAVTYVVVNFIGRGVLLLIENWNWGVFLNISIFMGVCAALIGLYYLARVLVIFIANKGLDDWYIKIAYYALLVVYWPLKIVFYYFFWQLLLVNLWYLVKGGARIIWGSLLGFLGIFGEYFGASYTDYCPGIEWEEK